MEFNRNQFLMGGILLLLLGLQFHTFESFTLSEKTTHFLASRFQDSGAGSGSILPAAVVGRKVVKPPQWLGWSLISVGSVLVLHSFGMQKPGGG